MSHPRIRYDAVVVGSGPNGFAAAIALARAGRSVLLREGAPVTGGGMRTEELTLPGHLHDVCSAVHPLAVASPFLAALPLADHGLRWLHAERPLAHPLDDGSAVTLERSIAATAAGLAADGQPYLSLMAPLDRRWDALLPGLLGVPLAPGRRLAALARFSRHGLLPATRITRRFTDERARALVAGNAAHSVIPLTHLGSAAFALVLMLAAHRVGWPIPAGGSRSLAAALAAEFRRLGGVIETDHPVTDIADLPSTRCVLLDVAPRNAVAILGDRLGARERRRLLAFHHGPGAFKVDWVVDGPVPWRSPECAGAGTLHLGGTAAEIAASERAAWRGRIAERPFVLAVQPSTVDPSRAPAGRSVLATYCHVPNGSGVDMTAAIEAQIERFAPGFRERVVARAVMGPAALERHNPNLVGGDFAGGANDLPRLLARPRLGRVPYRLGARGVYLCSASTPPGGGVHGMCGAHAAAAALHDGF